MRLRRCAKDNHMHGDRICVASVAKFCSPLCGDPCTPNFVCALVAWGREAGTSKLRASCLEKEFRATATWSRNEC